MIGLEQERTALALDGCLNGRSYDSVSNRPRAFKAQRHPQNRRPETARLITVLPSTQADESKKPFGAFSTELARGAACISMPLHESSGLSRAVGLRLRV